MAGKMRVLLLTDADVFAGTERHILDLAGALGELGENVIIGCPAQAMLAVRAANAGIGIYPVEKGSSLLDPATLRRLIQGLRKGKFEVIHSHNGRTALLATLAILLSGRGHLVATQHFLEPAHAQATGLRAALSRRVHRWIAARSHRVIAISEAVRAAALARRSVEPEKISVVLNGIKNPVGSQSDLAKAKRSALQIPDDAFFIVTAARLDKEKGIDVLIEAMSRIVTQAPQARCIVAGTGAARDGLQRLLEARRLTDHMALVGFRDDVLALIAAADLFVLPSHAEPFGLALIEAMALGKACVAGRAGGPAEIIEDQRTGRLVPPRDPAALAEAILSLMHQPAQLAECGRHGRERFTRHFTAKRMAEETRNIYHAIRAR